MQQHGDITDKIHVNKQRDINRLKRATAKMEACTSQYYRQVVEPLKQRQQEETFKEEQNRIISNQMNHLIAK